MLIITNADDFGLDEDTVRATIECFERNALTSATIMPNMPATYLAVDYARKNPDKSFGAHLTFVTDSVEAPLCDPGLLPTLVGSNGRFLDSRALRFRALLGRLSARDIEKETAMQLQRLLDLGVRLSHVDSHGHIHKFGPFRRVLAEVLPRFGITKVRTVQNVYLDKRPMSPTFWLGSRWGSGIRRLFTTTEKFFMPTAGAPSTSWPQQLMSRSMAAATMEVGVHPGFEEPWRDAERRCIQEFSATAEARGHRLVGWRELGT